MDRKNEITDAMEDIRNILIPSLQGYKCLPANTLYDFEVYPGGFCLSFPLQKEGKSIKKCLRLWFNDASREVRHIKEVAEYFRDNKPNYVLNYEYVERAFRLKDGTVIPAVVMDWIDGLTLIEYVRINYRNSILMKQLAESFRKMVFYLHRLGIAHGDLSGDNIIVDNRGQLSLVDYDSFYVKGMATNILQPTFGQGAYQHPKRMQGHDRFLNKEMDNFPEQVIYLSLMAIAAKPSIFNEDNDKVLVFMETELENMKAFTESVHYKIISEIRNPFIHYLLDELTRSLGANLSQVRSLFDIIDEAAGMVTHDPLYDYDKVDYPTNNQVKITDKKPSYASYCVKCGFKFTDEDYCPMCGTKRVFII